MALTKKGTQYADPDGHPLIGTVEVDADGYALMQFAVQQSNPALSTSYTAVSVAANAMFGATAPTANKLTQIFRLIVHLDTIVTAASITPKLTDDTAGDYPVWVGTSATIENGEATASRGSASWEISNLHFTNQQASFTLWLKLNAGTANLNTAFITWRALS